MSAGKQSVRKRRKLRFATFDDVVADAERANAERYEPLGNWSLGQAVKHLGTAILNKNRPVPLRQIPVDGLNGPKTIGAIEEFQRRVMNMPVPDGRVDLGRGTFKALNGEKPGAGMPGAGAWDLEKAGRHLESHAQPKAAGACARYVREAIEAGGPSLNRTNSAKDHGPSLTAVGFELSGTSLYLRGDVVIMQNFADHPHGHMPMYTGSKWISDFVQIDFWPGPAYRTSKPTFKIYRYGVLWDAVGKPSTTSFA